MFLLTEEIKDISIIWIGSGEKLSARLAALLTRKSGLAIVALAYQLYCSWIFSMGDEEFKHENTRGKESFLKKDSTKKVDVKNELNGEELSIDVRLNPETHQTKALND